ncbi:MAG: V-type ATP synthase subunit I [Tissierellaceae bacterium]|nr:V-type ATP synthase subunit I [Tissierellaceae bacterium]
MAIVKMSGFNLLAFDSERDNLLHQLQKFNYVHFSDLEDDESLKEIGLSNIEIPESIVALNEEISKVSKGIEILSEYQVKESGLKALKDGTESLNFEELEERALNIDYDKICNQVIELNTKIEALNQDISKIEASIDELSPWVKLNSPIKDLSSFKHIEVMLGTIPKKLKQNIENELVDTEYTYFEILSEDKDNLYALIMTYKDEEDAVKDILRNNSFSNSKIAIEGEPALEIEILNEKIKSLKHEISNYQEQIESLAAETHNLEIEYEYLMNKKLRLTASENFLSTDNLNVIKGFIPTDKTDEFTELVKTTLDNVYYLELEEAHKDDENVPILLENSKFVGSFESLTSMYAMPKYNEIDPTPYLAPFYLAFFGMMIADIGYGILMLIGTLVALKRFNLKESMKNSVRFFHYLSYSTIIWGMIYGSFLGGIIPLPALITPAEQYNELLIISVAFGAIHIFYALGIKAYINIRDGKLMDAIFDVGFWFMALIGGGLFLISIVVGLSATVKNVSLVIMILGMVGIVLTGGRDATSIPGKLAGGFYSLYGISSYVGDFVSYSRLMALGLSGGFIATAINMMVDMLFAKGILGIVGGIAVFVIGQAFNVFLSVLSAYVHTIRLTYVEFFGKFYEGGGTRFKHFRNKSKYIDVK